MGGPKPNILDLFPSYMHNPSTSPKIPEFGFRSPHSYYSYLVANTFTKNGKLPGYLRDNVCTTQIWDTPMFFHHY